MKLQNSTIVGTSEFIKENIEDGLDEIVALVTDENTVDFQINVITRTKNESGECAITANGLSVVDGYFSYNQTVINGTEEETKSAFELANVFRQSFSEVLAEIVDDCEFGEQPDTNVFNTIDEVEGNS